MSITTGSIMWASAGNSVYMPLFLLACFFVWYRHKKVTRTVRILAGVHVKEVMRNYSPRKQWLKSMVLCVGLLALFLALLQPQWQMEDEKRAQEGRDLLVALDISRSMLATDCVPDRLTCAKEKIKQLADALACERVGLILFSGSAFMQCPLTADYGAFSMLLDTVDVQTISSGTTALDQALRTALDVFKRMQERKNKLVVVFTDGEDFSSNLMGIKHEAAEVGMHVVTVGVGTTQGAPIPLYDEQGEPAGHQRDDKGAVVISKVNEGILQSLAHDCGGVYVRGTSDDQDVKKVVSYVQSFERERLAERSVSAAQEQFQWFAAFSFICFALAWLL